MLQSVQFRLGIYNSDIEPEHDSDFYCGCPTHQYQRAKISRLGVQERWSKAVMYPGRSCSSNKLQRIADWARERVGEKSYHDCNTVGLRLNNPYKYHVISPYGYGPSGIAFAGYTRQMMIRPNPAMYTEFVRQTIALNAKLNAEAQAKIDGKEPSFNIWEVDQLDAKMANMALEDAPTGQADDTKFPEDKKASVDGPSTGASQVIASPSTSATAASSKTSKFSAFKKAMSIKSSEERAASRVEKAKDQGRGLRDAILAEENGRWPDQEWRNLVAAYQDKVGMTKKIADLRVRHPIQYLHLLRAGYFEPIPVAWANLASNPLKFSIEAAAGWRGITPAWRGYEDTAEERLYWVLNHREGSVGQRLKPDFISALDMARRRMASAVEPPPAYYSLDDTCHLQHTSDGYSKQVMPPPFRAYDAPEVPTDDTMILLDVSGSMDFEPARPNYQGYYINGFSRSTQPKNKGERTQVCSSDERTDCFIRARRGKSHNSSLHRCHDQS